MVESKWIRFDLAPEQLQKPKTKVYWVHTKDWTDNLGTIQWYSPWRKYAFFPNEGCVFETQCISDIISFIKDLMEERHIEKQANKKV